MKRLCIHIGIIFLVGQACNLSVTNSLATPGEMATEASQLTMTVTQPNDPSPTLPTLPPHRLTQKRCGDGICDGPENTANCLADCPEDINTQQLPIPKGTPALEVSVVPNGTLPTEEVGPSTTLSGEGDVYQVTNPTSGAVLFVQVFHPDGWKGETLPALVLVPGGIGWSANFTDPPGSANILANTGFTVVIFDPDGRGRSQGSEDYDGFAHQDGLGAVINFTTGLPEVDKNRIGLISF